ncbi:DUF5703 domain-containing protein [Microbacter margulisiae]|uniref:DUF5703 domain-containing protein n=1 Tax=Microbacter margulisiae TaxID=1350067 RepID=A0A7W5H241_9PORP|nr:DUF5703 domain-containing protein [Microbacter margulisiae]MBB3187022.1 hypothetical protein [Microbacter margulisiae]
MNIRSGEALLLLVFVFFSSHLSGQPAELSQYNVVWRSQSHNSSESMPCGGGNIGLNVWVENGDLMFYIAQSGTFDENNTLLKLGRVRVHCTPNPFAGRFFRQDLILKDGFVSITGSNKNVKGTITIRCDVFHPNIHVDIQSNKLISTKVTYENWRYQDQKLRKGENFESSYKWDPYRSHATLKDDISFQKNGILFYHRNKSDSTIFDFTVHQQRMDSVKSEMFNPISHLTFGGMLIGRNMHPDGTHQGIYVDTPYKGWILSSNAPSHLAHFDIVLLTKQTATLSQWKTDLDKGLAQMQDSLQYNENASVKWWHDFWNRSFIIINPKNTDHHQIAWQVGRNYQLFRYMLGCNAYGKWPTKFNGGMFTFDPVFVDSTKHFTPDYRNWGGGIFTAQNQRLVYYPMLESGDFDMMKPEFNFYLNNLHNAELRSKVYWGHQGACFTEQIEDFGLPNCSEYGWHRPANANPGIEYNPWLEYLWDTSLEFCHMILQTQLYNHNNIARYIPLITSCLKFFDQHYQYEAKHLGSKALDGQGHLILYPGSAGETYKMAYNSTSTISALTTVTKELLALPTGYLDTATVSELRSFQKRIPPISLRECDGHKTISPAKVWARVNNSENPQLYPVFPWGIYGIGCPHLNIALNTWKYDPDVKKFESYIGWKQDNIWAAHLGLTQEAKRLTELKLANSQRRFPAFWGPGFDWAPDHNWGGTGMIGLQNMLMQCVGTKIYLFPAWPKNWNVHFKLYAPYQTIVEGELENGQIKALSVSPQSRTKDVINMLTQNVQ